MHILTFTISLACTHITFLSLSLKLSISFVTLKLTQIFILSRSYEVTLNDTHCRFCPVWPDWAIYCTSDNFSKPVARIILPKFSVKFCKGAKIFHYSSEIFLGNFYRHLATFYWSHWFRPTQTLVHFPLLALKQLLKRSQKIISFLSRILADLSTVTLDTKFELEI